MVRKEFEGLKNIERELVARFLLGKFITGEYTYNVKLYVPDPIFPPHYTQKDIEFWREKIAKRIDVVCETATEIWLLEVTPKVCRTAVGGLLLYRDMYIKQFAPKKPIKLGIIAEIEDPAYRDLLLQNNITLFIV